jgi:hypothetical protein
MSSTNWSHNSGLCCTISRARFVDFQEMDEVSVEELLQPHMKVSIVDLMELKKTLSNENK